MDMNSSIDLADLEPDEFAEGIARMIEYVLEANKKKNVVTGMSSFMSPSSSTAVERDEYATVLQE